MRTAWRKYQKVWVWLLLPSLVVAVAVGLYAYLFMPDQYCSTVGLYVLPSGVDVDEQYAPSTRDMIVRDCQQLLRNKELLDKAEAKLAPYTMDGMRLTVEGVPDTHVINMTVTGPDPELCQTAAIALSVVFTEHLQQVSDLKNVSVANRAQYPLEPVGPSRVPAILLAFLVCFAVGTLLFFLFVPKQETVRAEQVGPEDFGVPTLGKIPDFRKDLSRFFKNKGKQQRMLLQWVNRSCVEEIKNLSLCLKAREDKKPVTSLVLTSYSADEGKSSLTVLLGSELVNQGKRVLLVDMDCFAPTLGRLLGVHGKRDLIHHLGGEATIEQVMLPTGLPNLFLIDQVHLESMTTRVVGSKAFDAFLKRMTEEFDYVLFDSPPVSLFADAAALGSALDGTLLVVAENRISPSKLRDLVQKLQAAQNQLLGLAFTYVPGAKEKQYRDYEDVRRKQKEKRVPKPKAEAKGK